MIDQKDFKKILAGLIITTLIAGASLIGVVYPDGKGLEKAGGDIAGTINACIKRNLEGKPLAADSQEMKDLVAYIASLKK